MKKLFYFKWAIISVLVLMSWSLAANTSEDKSPSASCCTKVDNFVNRLDRMEQEMSSLKKENANLKSRVNRLESSSSPSKELTNKNFLHKFNKRDVSNEHLQPRHSCIAVGRPCMYFYPDYPDVDPKPLAQNNPTRNQKPNIITPRVTENSNLVPSSCQDLQLIGQTLNGYYSVRGLGENVNKIETIFCNFTELATLEKSEISNNAEKRIGFQDLKTKAVYFYAQKSSGLSIASTRLGPVNSQTITYDVERLNIGGGLNLLNGVFTVPLNGTYTFSFSALKSYAQVDTSAFLRVNGVQIGLAYATAQATYNAMVVHSTLKLMAGDKVDVWLKEGSIHDHAGHHTDFIGWLQEEDLTLV